MQYQSQFLQTLEERGFLHQCTDAEGLDRLLAEGKPIPAYIGFDCTAPSLHAGSLIQIMALRWLQKYGHKPIVLIGGGTTRIGDPSGKDAARQLLSKKEIEKNKEGIKQNFMQFMKFGNGPADAVMVDNAEWLDDINYLDFLRDYGRFFSVNRMLSFDSVKLRLDRQQHLSFLEFNYMILQAYDFVELNRLYACRLQIGGSDQWGNIINGIELHHHRASSDQWPVTSEDFSPDHRPPATGHSLLFGLTTPLLTTASGAKMGKTASGAIWLNAQMLSPYDYWQYWRNTDDRDVGKFLRLFTELPLEEIKNLENLPGARINEAKIVLASEATKLCHGEQAAAQAEATARQTFKEGGAGEALPEFEISARELEAGIPAFELFFRCGLAESKSEAKKLLRGGGGRVNDEKLTEETQPVTTAHLGEQGYLKLSAGRKRHAKVKVSGE